MKIGIIGTGAMGRWFARRLMAEHQVLAFDREKERIGLLPKVIRASALTDFVPFQPEILINAVSIRHTEDAFRQVLPFLTQNCILADIASIKGALPQFYRNGDHPYVSIHPMFGPRTCGRRRGCRENMIIISESDQTGKGFFHRFSTRNGFEVWEYSFADHDEMMAYSLTLPFAATIAFAACINGTEVPGTTFSRHMGIARRLLTEDEQLLSEILFNPHSVGRLEKICMNMEFLKHVIRARDQEEIHRVLSRLQKNIGVQLYHEREN